MKKLMITLTFAGAMLVGSAADAAVVVGVGPVRVGVGRAPIRRAYLAPRPWIRPVVRPAVVAPAVVRPIRPARGAFIRHRRHHIWHALH
jgi:hypothetical protein